MFDYNTVANNVFEEFSRHLIQVDNHCIRDVNQGTLTASDASQGYATFIQSGLTSLPISFGDVAYAAEDYVAPDLIVASTEIATATANATRLDQEAASITAAAITAATTAITKVAKEKQLLAVANKLPNAPTRKQGIQAHGDQSRRQHRDLLC